MNMDMLASWLTLDEGKRNLMYSDTAGIPTIGIGHNLRNKPISDRAVMTIFEDDMGDVFAGLDKYLPWWRTLDEVRQCVMANMVFNMGLGGLLGFRNTLVSIQQGQYQAAADGMRASAWYRQVPNRAERLCKAMETGALPKEVQYAQGNQS